MGVCMWMYACFTISRPALTHSSLKSVVLLFCEKICTTSFCFSLFFFFTLNSVCTFYQYLRLSVYMVVTTQLWFTPLSELQHVCSLTALIYSGFRTAVAELFLSTCDSAVFHVPFFNMDRHCVLCTAAALSQVLLGTDDAECFAWAFSRQSPSDVDGKWLCWLSTLISDNLHANGGGGVQFFR